jgi:glycosyltransferase involved in cell wall biosynthesis
MKILIAAASFSSSISGLQRHAFNVVHCLLQRPEISALHLVIAPWQSELPEAAGLTSSDKLSIHIGEMKRSSLSRNFWYYWRLPELATVLGADLAHLTFPMPVNGHAFSCPTVVTLHDLYPYEIPQNFGFPKFIFNRISLRQCLRKVDAIACVSEATSRTLRQYTPPSIWRKAARIYNCVEAARLCAIDSPIPHWSGQPFLLCVAQHRRNKNIPVLIKAFARLVRSGRMDPGSMLVVVGMQGPETQRIHRLISRLGLDRRIQFLEGVSDSELQWCYERCEAVVAPSITEGFGLPVAEGLLAGCRVVCSDIPVFREVGAEHCRYVALENRADEMFADEIFAALQEPKTASVSLPQFSTSLLAQEYVSLYRNIMTFYALSRDARRTSSVRTSVPERPSL